MNSRIRAVAATILFLDCQAFAQSSCLRAADQVEQQLNLPHGLLRSIGTVETGNHPWAVDSDGAGTNFASANDAIAYVRSNTSAHFVDVGCFQIDLAYHPTAFRTLNEAFDPVLNANAAGRYLLSLRQTTGSWSEAVAHYHSGQPERGRAYASRVLWGEQLNVAMNDIVIAGVHVVTPGHTAVRQAGLPTVLTP